MLWQAAEEPENDRGVHAVAVVARGSPRDANGGGPAPTTAARAGIHRRTLMTAWPVVRGASLALLALTCAACDIPRDPRGTLDRVRGGTMRVGVAEHAPWVILRGGRRGEPAGTEPQLLGAFARELGARVAWTAGPEAELMDALERGDLDVVASGLTRSTAWGDRVALTRPYRTTRTVAGRRREHVMAVPPGENGWLRRLEAFLAAWGTTPPGS